MPRRGSFFCTVADIAGANNFPCGRVLRTGAKPESWPLRSLTAVWQRLDLELEPHRRHTVRSLARRSVR